MTVFKIAPGYLAVSVVVAAFAGSFIRAGRSECGSFSKTIGNRWLGETTWVEDAQQARRISAEEASTIPWLYYGIALRSSLGPALRRVANADALRVSIRAKTQCHTGGVVKLPPTLRAALASDLRASRGARECSTPAVRRAAARRQPR